MIGYSKMAQIGEKKPNQTTKNKTANEQLDELYAIKKVDYCELFLSSHCLRVEKISYDKKLKLTYAHRHKRSWYKGKPETLLCSFSQTVRACLNCHALIENDRKLTDKMFLKLRGLE